MRVRHALMTYPQQSYDVSVHVYTYTKIPMYLRVTTFTKNLPQMSFHLYFLAICISLWGSTHDSADCWSAHSPPPSARVSFKSVPDARLCGVGRMPPKKKSWLRRCPVHLPLDLLVHLSTFPSTLPLLSRFHSHHQSTPVSYVGVLDNYTCKISLTCLRYPLYCEPIIRAYIYMIIH